MEIVIGGLKDASTIDYPGEMVSVLFMCQCPFRCPFCQNVDLVTGEDCTPATISDVIKQLKNHQKFITGLCITGGEPTVQIEPLTELLKQTKEIKLLNKLDTNGFYSARVQKLLTARLVDYVAMDVKSSLDAENYGVMIGNSALGAKAVTRVRDTLAILSQSGVSYEIRTTIVPNLNDSAERVDQVAKQLAEFNVPRYVLQQFRASGGTLDESLAKTPATEHDLLLELGKVAKAHLPDVRIRSIEAGEEKI
jgi:pyruvate formate lyase activating enzyme